MLDILLVIGVTIVWTLLVLNVDQATQYCLDKGLI